jgi:hypothetical protein
MSHLDEGTLHALLDGELDLAEVSEIQLHLGSCVACGSRLQEVKQILAEADRLVGGMEVPAGAARARPEPRRSPPPFRPAREPEIWDETPVLLIPESTDAIARRQRWLRRFRWAAVIAVLVFGGKLASDALRPGHPMLPERDLTSAAPAVPPAVVSPQESRKPETTVVARAKAPRTPAPRPPTQKLATKPEPAAVERSADTTSELTDAVALSAEDSILADSQSLAAGDSADSARGAALAAGAMADSVSPTQTARADVSDQTRESDELATRRAAAAALAELDRERRRERANAATAALPPAREEAPLAAESAPAPAPAPRTLEQRSQIYLRIGLDEAVKQLGGPVHVIEGMTPQFIGLIRGQQVPGADARRPVVRVVYLDARGRLILLDQQRIASGQAVGAASGNLRWAIGDVMLYLRGEPTLDVLRSLQARVR